MTDNRQNPVVILGAEGMLGRQMYSYAKQMWKNAVIGTTRNKNNLSKNCLQYFTAKEAENNLDNILKKLNTNSINIINCIGLLRKSENEMLSNYQDYALVNGYLPQFLAQFSLKTNSDLIHFSTDAVFPKQAGNVLEAVFPNPEDLYGYSKLLGEVGNHNALTIRTSPIGFDPINKRGLLEWLLDQTKSPAAIQGYTQQSWSGSTSLQCAEFVFDKLLQLSNFKLFKSTKYLLHFAPLGPFSKYELLQAFIEVLNLSITLEKETNTIQTRYLQTSYKDLYTNLNTKDDLRNEIQKLIKIEKEHYEN